MFTGGSRIALLRIARGLAALNAVKKWMLNISRTAIQTKSICFRGRHERLCFHVNDIATMPRVMWRNRKDG